MTTKKAPVNRGPMNFSDALVLLKAGKTMKRSGWNGRGMFVFLVPSRVSVLQGAHLCTVEAADNPLLRIYPKRSVIRQQARIDIRLPDDTIGMWTPTIEDVLAEDWKMSR